jgi:hypothetical protein
MKAFRSAVAMLAGLGGLLLMPAAAQAADYQVYKDAFKGDAKCAANAQCIIDFATVPAGQKLTITNLSCYLSHKEGVGLAALQLVVQKANFDRVFAVTPNLQLQSKVAVGDQQYFVWVSNDTIKAVTKAGQHVRVYAEVHKGTDGSVGTVEQLACGISGTLS